MGRIQSGMRPKLFPIPRSNGAPTTGPHANSDPPIVSVRVCVNPSRRGKTNNYASQKLCSSVNQVAVASPNGSCKTRISLQLQEMQHCNKHRIKHPSQNTHPVTWAQSLRILAVLRRFVRFTQIFFSLLPTPWRNVTPPWNPRRFLADSFWTRSFSSNHRPRSWSSLRAILPVLRNPAKCVRNWGSPSSPARAPVLQNAIHSLQQRHLVADLSEY